MAQPKALSEDILRTQGRMSQRQAQAFERRMRALVAKMDQAAKCGKDVGKEGPAKCMCNCDKAYPGWSKGKGWNRFWCKASYLVATVVKMNGTSPAGRGGN